MIIFIIITIQNIIKPKGTTCRCLIKLCPLRRINLLAYTAVQTKVIIKQIYQRQRNVEIRLPVLNLPLCARRRNCRYVVFAKSASFILYMYELIHPGADGSRKNLFTIDQVWTEIYLQS